MSQLAGETPEEYCKNAIKAEICMDLDDSEYLASCSATDGGKQLTESKKRPTPIQLQVDD
jgi:hypothetical protein